MANNPFSLSTAEVKIIHSDQENLVLYSFPWLAGILGLLWGFSCFGLTILAFWNGEYVGGIVFLLYVAWIFQMSSRISRNVLKFDLCRKEFIWTGRSLRGRRAITIPFNEICGVEIHTTMKTDTLWLWPRYQLWLITPHGNAVLTGPKKQKEPCRELQNLVASVIGHRLKTEAEEEAADLPRLICAWQFETAIKLVRFRRQCGRQEARKIVGELAATVRLAQTSDFSPPPTSL